MADLAAQLRARGWEAMEGVGASRLRCDVAIRRPGEARYRVGILVDRPEHWALGPDEALRLKPGVLRAFGWRVTTMLTKDWLADPASCIRTVGESPRRFTNNSSANSASPSSTGVSRFLTASRTASGTMLCTTERETYYVPPHCETREAARAF